MVATPRYDETITLPRALRFPLELLPPDGFDAERLETWPAVPGRLECVDGRLLYMPPCGDRQQDTVTDVVITIGSWVRSHPDFVLGTNEAGMRLAGSTRAADAAVWRRTDLGAYTGGLRRVPPVLAVEVAGEDEPEAILVAKARWYLEAGVAVVWLVLPETRQVLVLKSDGERRLGAGERLPGHPGLPDLAPLISELLQQVQAR
ncbi:MAG: Uma2 family endonuclease [Deltaproteobacteria bacterium]|nr:Uma2 family endonuclease [Deltaproteobacteria bacterium]